MDCGRTDHTVGEIFRRWGAEYSASQAMTWEQRRALDRLSKCRTAALGGHLEACDHCDFERPVYNSCRDRNCPTCQGISARMWLDRRMAELLPTHYFHCVFTVPDTFNPLVFAAPTVFYSILFQAMWGALATLFRRAGYGLPGILAALHTWGSGLWLHPHIHCVVTGGGLSADGKRWAASPRDWLLDVHDLSAEFQKRVLRLLKRRRQAFAGAPVDLDALLASEGERDWVAHCKPPSDGPAQTVSYLAGYAYRTAIGNGRILAVDDGGVEIDCKNYRDAEGDAPPEHTRLRLDGGEFIRRFMLHILPDSFKRIRFYGIWAGGPDNPRLAAARRLLPAPFVLEAPPPAPDRSTDASEFQNPAVCPHCGGRMRETIHLLPERAPPTVMPFRAQQEGHRHAA